MTKILVATDGSENSKRALLEARKYAKGVHGELTILTVVEYLVLKPYIGTEYPVLPEDEELEEVGQSVLDNALKSFEGYSGKVNTKLRRGNSADEIIREVNDGDYDVIIIGSRGQGTFSSAVLGSVSNKVLKNTNKNIFIIK